MYRTSSSREDAMSHARMNSGASVIPVGPTANTALKSTQGMLGRNSSMKNYPFGNSPQVGSRSSTPVPSESMSLTRMTSGATMPTSSSLSTAVSTPNLGRRTESASLLGQSPQLAAPNQPSRTNTPANSRQSLVQRPGTSSRYGANSGSPSRASAPDCRVEASVQAAMAEAKKELRVQLDDHFARIERRIEQVDQDHQSQHLQLKDLCDALAERSRAMSDYIKNKVAAIEVSLGDYVEFWKQEQSGLCEMFTTLKQDCDSWKGKVSRFTVDADLLQCEIDALRATNCALDRRLIVLESQGAEDPQSDQVKMKIERVVKDQSELSQMLDAQHQRFANYHTSIDSRLESLEHCLTEVQSSHASDVDGLQASFQQGLGALHDKVFSVDADLQELQKTSVKLWNHMDDAKEQFRQCLFKDHSYSPSVLSRNDGEEIMGTSLP